MLGLQEPLGKAVLQLVTSKALKMSFPYLCKWPQYAYLPQRSTRDALMRAASHCQQVKALLASQRRSVHDTTAAQPRLHCVGGIQLFVDLTRAFDTVPRPALAAALERIKLDPQLQSILLAWHIDTNYHIEVNGCSRTIPVSRGVRQGCTSAPLIWSAIMVLLLDNLRQHIPLQSGFWNISQYMLTISTSSVFSEMKRNYVMLLDILRLLSIPLNNWGSLLVHPSHV